MIAHELAHVVQQRQNRVRLFPGCTAIVQDPVLEAEAQRMAGKIQMLKSGSTWALGRSGFIQRSQDPNAPRLGGPSLAEDRSWNPFNVLSTDPDIREPAIEAHRSSSNQEALRARRRRERNARRARQRHHWGIIWEYLRTNGKARFFNPGPRMYYVHVGHPASQCHHFAFGNLQGPNSDFNITALFPDLAAPDIDAILRDGGDAMAAFGAYEERMAGYARGERRVAPVGEFRPRQTLTRRQRRLGLTGVAQEVCLMGTTRPPTDHSCRREQPRGLWWHKFVNLPYVLGFENPIVFGYTESERVTVRVPKGNYDTRKSRWHRP